MNVTDLMSPHLVSVLPSTSVTIVFTTIFKKRINAVPVIDSKNKLVGIITKDDLLKLLYPDFADFLSEFTESTNYEHLENRIPDIKGKTAKDVMNTHVIFAYTNTPALRALSRMIAQRVNQLPVVDDSQNVVGIVTKGDVFKTLFKPSKTRRRSVSLAR